MNVLVAGWFSWEHMGTTAGDLIARDIVCDWLREAGIKFDVAVHSVFPYTGAVEWTKAEGNKYTDLVFVCGPFGNGYPVTDMLAHFPNARLIGVDLSLLDTLDNWNPFALLYERDSSRDSHPDITFYAPAPAVPVVGIILAHKQKEYGSKGRHNAANAAISNLISSQQMAVVNIDTAITNNEGKLRTEGEIEALIARMDIVITTRLHGTVLALKNGVPVIPIDPIAGGAKITLQVQTIGWPVLFSVENLNEHSMLQAFKYCLTLPAKNRAKECASEAFQRTASIKERFISDMTTLSKNI